MVSEIKTALIVPFFNEEKRFASEYINELLDAVGNLDCFVILVNDGSTDGTSEILKTYADLYQCHYLNIEFNVGKSNAVRMGMARALELIPAISYIGFVDGDGAFDVTDVCHLIRESRRLEVDVVVGSRIKLAGSEINRKQSRHIIGRVISTFLNEFVLPTSIYDPQTGLKIFYVSEIFSGSLKKPFLTKWFGDVEILLRLQDLENFQIKEMPVSKWSDIKDGSLNIRSFYTVLRDLFLICRLMLIKR